MPSSKVENFIESNTVSKKPVYLFAKWKVREGHLEKVLSLLPKLAELSRAEEGCIFLSCASGALGAQYADAV